MATKLELMAALEAVPTAEMLAVAQKAYACWGCARIYVKLVDKADVKPLKAAGAKIVDAYGCGGGKAVYAGYQNFEPKTAAKALAIEAALKAVGVSCYVDAMGD